MCIFKSQLIDKGTNKVTKENVVYDYSPVMRFDLAHKDIEEHARLGWSLKSSQMCGAGYYKMVYVRADPNRYKDVGKTNESNEDAEHALSGVGSTEVAQEVVATEVKETTANETPVKEVVKPTRKTTAKKA